MERNVIPAEALNKMREIIIPGEKVDTFLTQYAGDPKPHGSHPISLYAAEKFVFAELGEEVGKASIQLAVQEAYKQLPGYQDRVSWQLNDTCAINRLRPGSGQEIRAHDLLSPGYGEVIVVSGFETTAYWCDDNRIIKAPSDLVIVPRHASWHENSLRAYVNAREMAKIGGLPIKEEGHFFGVAIKLSEYEHNEKVRDALQKACLNRPEYESEAAYMIDSLWQTKLCLEYRACLEEALGEPLEKSNEELRAIFIEACEKGDLSFMVQPHLVYIDVEDVVQATLHHRLHITNELPSWPKAKWPI